MTYNESKSDEFGRVITSLRLGYMELSQVKFIMDYYLELEEYGRVAGAMEAYNEYKKELDDEYRHREIKEDS